MTQFENSGTHTAAERAAESGGYGLLPPVQNEDVARAAYNSTGTHAAQGAARRGYDGLPASARNGVVAAYLASGARAMVKEENASLSLTSGLCVASGRGLFSCDGLPSMPKDANSAAHVHLEMPIASLNEHGAVHLLAGDGVDADVVDKVLAAGFDADFVGKVLATGFNAEAVHKILAASFNVDVVDKVLAADFDAKAVHTVLDAGFNAEAVEKVLATGFNADLVDKVLAAGFDFEAVEKVLATGFNADLVDKVLAAGFDVEVVEKPLSKYGMSSRECSCFVSTVRRWFPVMGVVTASLAVNGIVGEATPASALGHFVLLLCGLSLATLPFLGA